MKRQNNHTALLMFAIAITLVVYASYGYMYYSVGVSLDRALAAREAVRKEETYKMQGQSLRNVHDITESDRAKLGTFFVADDKKVSFIETLESLGENTGSKVTLSSIVADDLATSKPGTLGKVSIHVDVQGTWSSVMRTLLLAENLPYKVLVSGVRLDASGAPNEKNSRQEWHASFVLDTVSIRNAN